MARIVAPSSLCTLLFISSLFLSVSQIHARSLESGKLERAPVTAKGLSYDYYSESCPSLETVARKYFEQVFAKDITVGPTILRLFFHDCFSEGCDASMLLHRENGEVVARDNQGIRPSVLDTIEDFRALIHKQCLIRVVSCSDIITIAAREAVHQYGGPDFDVPLGRKDSLTFNLSSVYNLPSAKSRIGQQLEIYAKKNFDATDLVALSGAHTYGISHCASLHRRLEEEQPPIDPELKNKLEARCGNKLGVPRLYLDLRTPFKFDNMYYINLLNNQGVLTSDQELTSDPMTKELVNSFASDEKLFFDKFAIGFVKVSQLNVLTGNDGEIRKSCFATNREVSSEEEEVELVAKI